LGQLFGLSEGCSEILYENLEFEISPREIVAVVGPSGAGKSVLLRQIRKSVRGAICLDVQKLSSSRKPAVSVMQGGSLDERLEVLSRCGLAEAATLITPARRLSGGQLYRLGLARAIYEAKRSGRERLVIADEFAAILDTETALVLCRQLRKIARDFDIALVLAMPRGELVRALKPDKTIIRPLGKPAVLVKGSPGGIASINPNRWKISRGTIQDYRSLENFHYVAGPPATHKLVYVIRRPKSVIAKGGPDIAAALVISPPLINCRARNMALTGRYTQPDRREAMGYLNDEIEAISRVVVHPIYRGCGLAVRLVKHALSSAQTPMVEALAAMGGVHPFFEKGGLVCHGRFKGQRGYYFYYLAKLLEWGKNT